MFENTIMIRYPKGSKEYDKAMDRIKSTWSYDRPSTYIRMRIETINKIKEEG